MLFMFILVQKPELDDLDDMYITTIDSINQDEAIIKLVSQIDYTIIVNYLYVLNYYSYLFPNFDYRLKEINDFFKSGLYDKIWYNDNIKLISDLIKSHMNSKLIKIL